MSKRRARPARDLYAGFFEQPDLVSLRNLLKEHVGELREFDFKETWPEGSDLARHVLGLANSGGGCVVAGVRERDDKTLEAIGLQTLTDKADLEKSITKYLPPDLLTSIDILDFSYDESEYGKLNGKKFQVLLVNDDVADRRPFISISDGSKISVAGIYVRREGQTCRANHHEMQHLINGRIEAGASSAPTLDLQGHLDQLRLLFTNLRKHGGLFGSSNIHRMALGFAALDARVGADFDQFLINLIHAKKARIERELGVGASTELQKLLHEPAYRAQVVKSKIYDSKE